MPNLDVHDRRTDLPGGGDHSLRIGIQKFAIGRL
jgi:hypothetical protein